MALRRLRAVMLVCIAVGLLRITYFHLVHEHILTWDATTVRPPIDARYAGLMQVLPLAERLFYETDRSFPGDFDDILYFGARYALAPRELVQGPAGTSLEYGIVNLYHPEEMARWCRARGLRPLSLFPGGLALVTRGSRP